RMIRACIVLRASAPVVCELFDTAAIIRSLAPEPGCFDLNLRIAARQPVLAAMLRLVSGDHERPVERPASRWHARQAASESVARPVVAIPGFCETPIRESPRPGTMPQPPSAS